MFNLLPWVLLCAEADEAVVKGINPEWVEAGHERKDPEVILEAIEEVGVDDVLTGYVRFWHKLALWDASRILHDSNAPAALRIERSVQPKIRLIALTLLQKLGVIMDVCQQVALRCNVILSREFELHSFHIGCQQVFSSQLQCLREVVNFLKFIQGFDVLRIYRFGDSHIKKRAFFYFLFHLSHWESRIFDCVLEKVRVDLISSHWHEEICYVFSI